MKRIKTKKLLGAVSIGLIAAILAVLLPFFKECDDIRQNVFRLHILANSDSAADQALKLSVRDEILKLSEVLFEGADTKEEAIELAKDNIPLLEDCAKQVIEDSGFDYCVTVSVDKSWFATREYDDFTLPAGNYEALLIKIGDAGGKNWWCVMFPSVCIPAASGNIEDALDKNETEIVTNASRYRPAFKIVEIYERIKRYFKK